MMTAQVRRVAVVLFVLFAALFVNLNYLQVVRAGQLAEHDRNSRALLREYARQRGSILVGTGPTAVELAASVETDDRLRYLRVYPHGPLYAHATGFYSYIYGRTQLEDTFNAALVGDTGPFGRALADLLTGRERRGDDIAVTLRPAVQQAAAAGLGERRGAVIALAPSTGQVLALWSNPSYDPNLLVHHDRSVVINAWQALQADAAKPMLNRVTRERYPPGSTFKLVTAAAALRAGIDAGTLFPDPRTFDVPATTADIGNFGGGLCNRGRALDLAKALAVSCNTVFARLGIEVGAQALVEQAQRFGLNTEWDFDLPLVPSLIPADLDAPATAQSAIGQRDVRVTPLQMGMIAAAIANGGLLMRPYLVSHVEGFAGGVLQEFDPQRLEVPGAEDGQAVPAEDAAVLRDLMVGVVERGSGTAARIPGVTVAGKTGTAQTGEGRPPTVWFVGFAPAEQPVVAVAVVVEEGPGVDAEATGGRIAAPIARAVMEAALSGAGEET